MKIAIGAEHAGFELKKQVKAHLHLKHKVVDVGVRRFGFTPERIVEEAREQLRNLSEAQSKADTLMAA
jgi:hypothetical protein